MNQDEIRDYFSSNEAVYTQISAPGDGSPEIAWGDTFFYVRDGRGEPKKMPFATIVTKDYDGFDVESNLNRGGLFRLNLDLGREKFRELFGFNPKEFGDNRHQFDFAALNKLFPHPLYGANGWASIINPEDKANGIILSLMQFSLERVGKHTGI